MKKVKLLRLFISSFVLPSKHGWNRRFYTANFIFDLRKSDLVFDNI